MRRRRLDSEIVRRKLAGSKQEATALVDAGRVTVGGAPATNAGRFVGADEAVVIVDEPPQFVTRAGAKLAAALERFDLPTEGVRALDAGASGGGFTDCLLQHGAHHVVAVDVGYGQIHERLRTDPRVEVRDRTNVRDLVPGDLGDPFDLVVADLSFISLRTVLPSLLGQAKPGANLVVLVKPQFEATRAEASEGKGVIRDPEIWRRVLTEITDEAARLGASSTAAARSPIRGADGNVEFLLLLRAPGTQPVQTPDRLHVDGVIAEAAEARRWRA
jgi:23S rRNA (cytidine1920-2'-O)/16S rRNA (cytidine1409-2'-O)-methyltransferase